MPLGVQFSMTCMNASPGDSAQLCDRYAVHRFYRSTANYQSPVTKYRSPKPKPAVRDGRPALRVTHLVALRQGGNTHIALRLSSLLRWTERLQLLRRKLCYRAAGIVLLHLLVDFACLKRLVIILVEIRQFELSRGFAYGGGRLFDQPFKQVNCLLCLAGVLIDGPQRQLGQTANFFVPAVGNCL